MNAVDMMVGATAGIAFIGIILSSYAVGRAQGQTAGFNEGWREALIEDDTIDAEWEERGVMLPPPPRKRLLQ